MLVNGNRGPHSLPSGAMEAGPVVPWQPPSMLGATTKNRSVSIALPGPTIPCHQPAVGCPGPAAPTTWLSPVSACSTSTALSRAAESSPHVSYATRTYGRDSPLSNVNGPIPANEREPTGSDSFQAPLAGVCRGATGPAPR